MQAIDWSDLQVFLTVARAGQLGRAGTLLGVNGTTVARRIRRLEQRLGSILFEQTRDGQVLTEQRLDETEAGLGTAATLLDARLEPRWVREAGAANVAAALGLDVQARDLLAWDAFDAVLAPGDAIVLATWRDAEAARASLAHAAGETARRRQVRVVRDYGMFDRREAPQHHPPAQRPDRSESSTVS